MYEFLCPFDEMLSSEKLPACVSPELRISALSCQFLVEKPSWRKAIYSHLHLLDIPEIIK